MHTALLIVFAAALGQAPVGLIPIDAPPPPEVTDATTYTIEFSDGRGETQAFVTENGQQVSYYEDKPWAVYPAPKKIVPINRIQERYPEGSATRKSRLEKGFAEAGYTAVEGYWVPKDLADLSGRAHEMYAAAQAKQEELATEDSPSTDAPPAEPAVVEATPPLQRWGVHAIIAVVGLGVCALLARRFLMEN